VVEAEDDNKTRDIIFYLAAHCCGFLFFRFSALYFIIK